MMVGRRGFTMMFVVLALVNTISCAESAEAKAENDASGEKSLETKSTVPPPATVTVATVVNVTVASSVSTEKPEDDEKPITETIRTYIEDSVKSVKHAISKIGKFVGELFEDAPKSNSTAPVNATVVPAVILSSTVAPTTDKH
ncbi:hypothetical protein GCK72_004916 [Caenorhabditis remanei]|uniref:Uncharacterized protein n=1 Tax=Caenorhabditis remanei TaxID=31234 RepID=A0A6A5HCG1_CAERE|nr:hypothetical protein GCK72_004916 [Caenorhabditis remanei]KAF1764965.1 hypothetical protein GCK72_004916 [Caenorhabditis remanei]